MSGHEVILNEVVNLPPPRRNREFIFKQIVLRMRDNSTHIILRFSLEKVPFAFLPASCLDSVYLAPNTKAV